MNKQIIAHKGGKAGGGSGRVAQEAPNTLQNNTVAKVIDVLSEGEIVGLVDGDKSVFFDSTPLKNFDDTYNFQGVIVEERVGTSNQDYLAGFQSVETEVAAGNEILFASPVIKTITDADIDAIRAKIRLPVLTFQDTTNGDLSGSSVELKIEVQPNGGSYAPAVGVPNPIVISGKTTSPYETDFRVPLPAGGAPWNVKITRLTADSAQANLQNKTYWSAYTLLIDNKLAYPNVGLIGLRVDARQFNQAIPSRAYEIKGRIIKIPSNYDPETREYDGIWDGTFTTGWSDNPAWVLYDLLTNTRYGLGEVIPEDLIDKYGLYAIAQYNDELVADGFGGQEPRFTFNGVLQTREEAYDVISSVASSMDCQVFWSSGLIMVTQDRPSDPVKIVSPANVIDGNITYTGSALKARHSVVAVRWNDPEDTFQSAIMLVEDPDMIDTLGWRQKDVVAIGCTSRGQAHRKGKKILDDERYSTEVVSYKASLDHIDVRPGDIVAVQDPNYAGIRLAGRIVAATTTSATLDDYIKFEVGETYTLSMMLPDGTIAERLLTNASDGSQYLTVTWSSAVDEAPQVNAMWVITGSNIAPRQFRIVSVVETEPNIFDVSGLYHDPTKYTRIETGFSLAQTPFSIIPSGPLEAPTGLSFVEYVYQAGPRVKSATTLSWTGAPDPRVAFYQIEIIRPNTTFWDGVGATTSVSMNIEDTPSGIYSFRVRSVDNTGRFSPYTTLLNQNLLGLLAPPGDVEEFRISVNGDLAFLSWSPVPDLDVAYYLIKFRPETSGATWSNSVVLVPRISRDATSVAVPARVGTYLIKAVDYAGVESVNETLIVTSDQLISTTNAVETITEDPTWAGTKTDVIEDTGVLKLDIGVTSGTYNFDNEIDLGAVYVSRVTPLITAAGEDTSEFMDDWPTLLSVSALSSANPSDWNVVIEVRTTEDDPGGSPVWSSWEPLIISEYQARAFQFRLLLSSISTNITPVVVECSVTVDMPDRIEKNNDVESFSGSALSISYLTPFKEVPAVNITAQDLSQGDYWVITNSTTSGFDIRFYNVSNTGVVRTFDWTAVGYGNEVV